MIKFIHTADIHLDSPMRGLARYDSAPVEEIRGATREAFKNLVNFAIKEQVDFILIAGDLYDGDWKDYNTGLFFSSQMAKLREANIKVFLIYGNHDARSNITKSLRHGSNVFSFPSHKASTHLIEEYSIAIHGQSFAKSAMTDNIAHDYPAPVKGFFNIGLLHTSLSGSPDHEPYAPCSVEGLRNKGYQYWALGHIHGHEVVTADPWIVFPGNLQGRHIREAGAKGACLVTIRDGCVNALEKVDFDVLRWRIGTASINGVADEEVLLARVRAAFEASLREADDRFLAIRLVLEGSGEIHNLILKAPYRLTEEIRAVAFDTCGQRVWLEKIVFNTNYELGSEINENRQDAIGKLLHTINDLELKIEDISHLKKQYLPLATKLPAQVKEGGEPFDPTSEKTLKNSFKAAKKLLVSSLLAIGDET